METTDLPVLLRRTNNKVKLLRMACPHLKISTKEYATSYTRMLNRIGRTEIRLKASIPMVLDIADNREITSIKLVELLFLHK
jgi:hypothetical protein